MTMRARTTIGIALVALAAGCAARPAKDAQANAPAPIASASAVSEPEAIPTECAGEQSIKSAKVCLPPAAFAKKLCGGVYPEVALAMFTKGTAWTRVWLAGEVEAWNASGGLTHRATLAFDEEVLVLSRHATGNGGGIVVSGSAASYDVLRWDGTCVSVMEGELTTRRPPSPKPTRVPWSRLDEPTRRALLTSPKVKSAQASLDKACGSASSTSEGKACEKAEKAFDGAIADFVRSGAALPTPARRP